MVVNRKSIYKSLLDRGKALRWFRKFLYGLRYYAKGIAHGLRYYAKGIVREVEEKDVFLWAGAIAFKVLISFLPLIILTAGVFGLILRQDDPFTTVIAFIEQFLPEYQSQTVVDTMYALARAGNTITLIGIVGFMVLVITLFTSVRQVISNVFHGYDPRSILMGYLFDMRLALQVSLLFLLSLGLTIVAHSLPATGVDFLRAMHLDTYWLLRGWRGITGVILLVLPFVITVAMFFQFFYFIPRPHPTVKSALVGSLVTALLWEIAKFAFTYYATTFATFERYGGTGGETGLAPLGDFFGLIIALVFWVYYSGIVLIIGAIIAALYQKRRQKRLRDKSSDGRSRVSV